MNLKKIDKKLMRMIILFSGLFLLIIIFIIVGKILIGNRIPYTQIETKMKNAAISYYTTRTDKLPKQDGEKVTVSVEDLVEAKKIKPLSKLTQNKKAVCTGHVTVANNNGYYLYLPYLDCKDDYQTTTLVSKLTDLSKIVASGNGLYQMGDSYIYRGEYVDNYVSFANQLWRIIKIDENNTIRMLQVESNSTTDVVWDNRYNSEVKRAYGINQYSISRIHDRVVELYNNEKVFTSTDKSYIVSHDMCIGKRSKYEEVNDGSIECAEKMEKQPLGLLQANEFLLASIDPGCKGSRTPSCSNYNYLTQISGTFWSITADSETSTDVFAISSNVYLEQASSREQLNVVLHLSGDIIYTSGEGTKDNPYIIQ